MTKEQFDALDIGDKVCITMRPEIWGYVEDISRESEAIEFDQEETVANLIPKDTEIKVHYGYLTLLLKKPKEGSAILEKLKTILEENGYVVTKVV